MAIIDTITGYYGFTLDGTVGGTPIDENGQVNRCIIAIVYPVQSNDVDVEISNGKNDWAVQMGDGEIIPCSNPEILYINRDNTIIQFDMDKLYPSNSPCTLVYHSDTASFNIVERSSSRPFEVNAVSGHFAFTVNGYEGPEGENGNVKRILATIPFPYQISAVKVTISDDPSHWGARMGNGEIIPLRNPEVVATNSENVIVKFDMDEWYPSNSPCILVYRNKDASIDIEEIDDDHKFHPVNTIIDVPNKMISGQTLDLNIAKVTPWNATNKNIDWAVVEGPGRIEERHYLYATGSGKIVLRATIENSLEGDDDVNDFVQSFDINVEQNIISIDAQPIAEIDNVIGEINYEISVVAKSSTNRLTFQWFSSDKITLENSKAITNATDSKFIIPPSLEKGDYYYFCRIISPGAATVDSNICHVHVAIPCTGIKILPSTNKITINEERQLSIKLTPEDAEMRNIIWDTSNSDIIEINNDGLIKSKVIPSNTTKKVTITATRLDGKPEHTLSTTLDITVEKFIPVSDITGIPAVIEPGTSIDLTGIVHPSDASHQSIEWTIINHSDTEGGEINPTLKDGVLSIPKSVNDKYHNRWISVRGTIKEGTIDHQDYSKEFFINIKNGFIPVDDIVLDESINLNTIIGKTIILNGKVKPSNASKKDIIFEIHNQGTTDATMIGKNIVFNSIGNCIITATVKAGNLDGSDFIKTFKFTVIEPDLISVDHIDLELENYDPLSNNGAAIPFNYTVYPEDATNKVANIEVIDPSIIQVKYNSATQKISSDPSLMTFKDNPVAIFKFTIPNGISTGIDFVSEISLRIIPPETPDHFVPVSDIEISYPTDKSGNPLIRALYPILLNRFNVSPDNYGFNVSTDKEVEQLEFRFDPDEMEEDTDSKCVIYNPNDWDNNATNILSTFFDWDLDEAYLFIWNAGICRFNARCINGDTTDHDDIYCNDFIDFVQHYNIEVKDPFIAVRDIYNVPETIYANQKYILTPELDTKGGINFYNPGWDEEVPTDTTVFFDIDDIPNPETFKNETGINTAGGKIVDNSIFEATKTGEVEIQAWISYGICEYINWYGKIQYPRAFTKKYKINVVAEEKELSYPWVTLTLNDGTDIEVKKYGEYSMLANDKPGDYEITVAGKTFKKNQVTKIKFWDANETPDITDLSNFARNFTGLSSIDRIPSVEGGICLRNFMMGCTAFNKPIIIPEVKSGNSLMYFMRGCTAFNSNITLPTSSITGKDCMHGFLYGCTSFNKYIEIPETVTGEGCLERFLYGCTEFNQPVNIPSGVSGKACLRDFLTECTSFNQPLTLPDNVGTENFTLCAMLKNCDSMCSEITVPLETGNNAFCNERSFSTLHENAPMFTKGIPFSGEGAEKLLSNIYNWPDPPRRNVYKK